ncbi:MAG: DUF523 domain-containing protein [Succiniclasticum sp.]|jgi:uncharacterized protein YbbK (DUF523 family)|nr:DUF523 domain-containing protein [Succiniclasticum sp.]MEE3478828.1 DUF523 domain-containing protein [Succiniclasticum sp.]
MRIMVSACLLGTNCKYTGGNNAHAKVLALARDPANEIIPVCPEVMGGLPTPRPPAEVQPGGRVVTQDGRDVTREYRAGAEHCLALARKYQPDRIILQSRSPSCGVRERYDGTFTHTRVPGQGVTAALLVQNGFSVEDVQDIGPEGCSDR